MLITNLKNNFKLILLFLILLLSLFLNLYNNHFEIGLHTDEVVKFRYVLTHGYNFLHPHLMIQLPTLVARIFNVTSVQTAILIARTFTGIAETITVLLLFLLARRAFRNNYYALLTALVCAVSPILVIHAHYYKEDILFGTTALFFLYALSQFIRFANGFSARRKTRKTAGVYTEVHDCRDRVLQQSRKFISEAYIKKIDKRSNIILLGIAFGLAYSSKYVGFLLSLLLLITPFIFKIPDKFRYYKNSLVVFGISIATFLLVNYLMILNPIKFWIKSTHEIHHGWVGHNDIKIYPLSQFFSFHLTHSIIPGITFTVTLFALMGLMLALLYWKKEAIETKLLFIFAILFYFIHEISPLKPYPDFARYMVCITPALLFFSVYFLKIMIEKFKLYQNSYVYASVISLFIALSCIVPLYQSFKLDYYMVNDTRLAARQWYKENEAQACIWQRYVFPRRIPAQYVDYLDPEEKILQLDYPKTTINCPQDLIYIKNSGYRYVAVSSFYYQRYLDAQNYPYQTSGIKAQGKFLAWVFSHYNFMEIKSKYKTFAFSNPTIRIIDLHRPKTSQIKLANLDI